LNDLTDVHLELASEQAYLDLLYARLDALREETRARLAVALRAEAAEGPQGLSDRDAAVSVYEQRLAALEGVDDHLCFGRLDLRDGSCLYVGRIGLADERNQPLLVDWRAPAAAVFYQATAAAPGEVVRRRHLTTRERRVVSIEDDVLDLAALDDADRRHLVGEGALLAAVQAARTGRMGDIVATIQAEQDQVIRADHRGVLVVQGGPGTGKTVVALHRTAYLLYTHRDRLARHGVLLVGPSPVFLRYIERVLPSLGETGVVMSTPGMLFPGVNTVLEDPPATARLKGDVVMVEVLDRAIRQWQRVPKAPVELAVEGTAITVMPGAFAAARRHARSSGKLHNAARPVFVKHILFHLRDLLAEQVAPGEQLDAADRAELLDELLAAEEVRRVVRAAWPPLTPQQLLAGLYADPRRLAAAAADLSAADRALLQRAPEDAERWTVSDVPLLDEAAELLGTDDTAERQAARLAAEQRREEVAFARRALQFTGGLARARVSAETLAERFRDPGPQLTVAQRAEQDRAWTYGHIVVDEAQELSAMAWRLLMRRCPSRSMTIVGDIAQTSSAAAAGSWTDALAPYVQDRWRLAELIVNYRTPAAVMDVAAAVLGAAGIRATTPASVRAGDMPRAERLPSGSPDALADLVRREHADLGERRLAVIAPAGGSWAADRLAGALEAALPAGAVGYGPTAIDAPVAVLDPRQCKGLEVDIVILVEPADILSAATRGANDLYVAITRATQRLLVVHAADLPPGMELLAESPSAAMLQ
jgi:DNA helicase IV